MRYYAKLLRSTLTASLMLVVITGAAAAGKFEDAKAALNRRDYTTGLRLLRPLAKQGDAAAQFVFGLLYYMGQGLPKNYAEAVKWFHKAAEQGNVEAQVMLGTMYRDGQGLPQNYTEAAKWYRKAAEQGDDIAQSELGVMYARGQGVPKNQAEAVKWWHKAADQGNTAAERNLALDLCQNDWTKCSDNADMIEYYSKMNEAREACERSLVENAAPFGELEYPPTSRPEPTFGSFYPGNEYPKTGVVKIIQPRVRISSGTGAPVVSAVECWYNFRNEEAKILHILDPSNPYWTLQPID